MYACAERKKNIEYHSHGIDEICGDVRAASDRLKMPGREVCECVCARQKGGRNAYIAFSCQRKIVSPPERAASGFDCMIASFIKLDWIDISNNIRTRPIISPHAMNAADRPMEAEKSS